MIEIRRIGEKTGYRSSERGVRPFRKNDPGIRGRASGRFGRTLRRGDFVETKSFSGHNRNIFRF